MLTYPDIYTGQEICPKCGKNQFSVKFVPATESFMGLEFIWLTCLACSAQLVLKPQDGTP